MEKKEILVSINCIVYNHKEYIKDTLEGFLMQKTNFNYEILINDDASTDGTAEIIKEYEKKYPNLIKPLYQIQNQYSKGINMFDINNKRAKGKYIAYCEGDDYWTDPFKLQKQVDYMEENEKCGMCFHKIEILDHRQNKIIGEEGAYNKSKVCLVDDIIEKGGSFVATCSIMVRKSLIDRSEFYNKFCSWSYGTKLFFSSKEYSYYMNESMGVYRVNTGTNWTSINSSIEKKKESFLIVIDLLENFDKYSQKKYNKIIEKRIKKYYFYILKLNLFDNTLEKNKKREFYNKLTLRKKIELSFFKIRNYILKGRNK